MPISAAMVKFDSDGHQLAGYLARPDGDGPFPAVVVIHEIYGLSDNIKDIARRFADEGYIALSVDLFAERNRVVCMFRFLGMAAVGSTDNLGIRDLKNALTYLEQQPGVNRNRLGAIGFCLGGGFALGWAATDQRLKAIASFYGMNPRPLSIMERACPIVGSYPEKDFTLGPGKKLDAALNQYNIPHDIKVYPGARHSFFNDQGSNYNEAAAKDAWSRVIAFFKEHI